MPLAAACLAIAGCHVEGDAGDGPSEPVAGDGAVAVRSYCEAFARAYAAMKGVGLVEDSVRADAASEVARWMTNLFQPAGSGFSGGYRCRFAAVLSPGERGAVSVGLYLAETRAFAEHTQWRDLQIVPIERVADEARGRDGYGVFKYLRQE